MAKTAITPALYCRKCSYDLRGQVEHRCPECGRPYDPADAKTFRRRPRGRAGKWIKRIAVALAVLLLIAAAPYAWLYYDWRQEQPAVRRMKELGANVGYEPISVPVLPRLLPHRYGWMLERVEVIAFPRLELTDADFILVSHCRRLGRLYLDRSPVSDHGIEAVSGIGNLHVLVASGKKITDASASRLAQCPQLQELHFFDTSLTNEGLARLCGLKQLTWLSLEAPALTDTGLTALANLPKLDTLWLYAPSIDDDGLATLGRLQGLRHLYVSADGYTPAGEERLRRSLLNCTILLHRYSPALTTAPSTSPSP